MLFNSAEFLLFFPLVVCGYFLLYPSVRWAWLLTASCFFYMFFKPSYILILAFTIAVDYVAGILIERSTGRTRRVYLVASLISNIGVLAIYKYFNFINDNATTLLGVIGIHNPVPNLSWILPIGLSFHTFQAMSYTIEVYRGAQRAEKHLGIYALYVMFFPQLVAGPIERPQNLLHEFHQTKRFTYDNLMHGLTLIASGLFRKIVVADNLALHVDPVFAHPGAASSTSVLIAVFLYAFQIYCDFSGYSEIALGTARVFGIKLMTNFDRPFLATNIVDFWHRWHISLSTWFRDYLYTPLLSGWGAERWLASTVIVFLISGLWHGANWTFVVWGALHAVFMVLTISLAPPVSRLVSQAALGGWNWLLYLAGRIHTFFLAAFAFIFFRASSVTQAFHLIRRIGAMHFGLDLVHDPLFATAFRFHLMECVGFLVLLGLGELLLPRDLAFLRHKGAFIALMLWMVILFGEFGSRSFIYFQF
jgi:D-alanyl-lipoteichoic acid acyltransferase DltB (MBOAT superfamily)